MTEYSVDVHSSAQKELDGLRDDVFARIDRKILLLPSAPRPAGCAKLSGYKDLWRIRIGDWRVVYRIDDSKKHINIVRVAHRREVYEP